MPRKRENHGVLTTTEEDGSFRTEVVPTAYDENYRTFYAIFAKALAGEGDVPVPPEGVVKVIRLIEMCKESAKLRILLNFEERLQLRHCVMIFETDLVDDRGRHSWM